MTNHERLLRWMLRIVGSASLLALPCVALPHSWMNATHRWLGMGPLPDAPIVGYLARSTSAFYAMLGGLLWVLSLDLRRNRPTLRFVGAATACFGITLLAVDCFVGMPLFWSLFEGPFDCAFGLAILWLTRHIAG